MITNLHPDVSSDENARISPRLRLHAAQLAEYFGEKLALIAADMADSDDPFELDEAAVLLVWTFAEYLGDVTIERDSEVFNTLRKPHQLTLRYIDTWYTIESALIDGKIVRAVLNADKQPVLYDDGDFDVKNVRRTKEKTPAAPEAGPKPDETPASE